MRKRSPNHLAMPFILTTQRACHASSVSQAVIIGLLPTSCRAQTRGPTIIDHTRGEEGRGESCSRGPLPRKLFPCRDQFRDMDIQARSLSYPSSSYGTVRVGPGANLLGHHTDPLSMHISCTAVGLFHSWGARSFPRRVFFHSFLLFCAFGDC